MIVSKLIYTNNLFFLIVFQNLIFYIIYNPIRNTVTPPFHIYTYITTFKINTYDHISNMNVKKSFNFFFNKLSRILERNYTSQYFTLSMLTYVTNCYNGYSTFLDDDDEYPVVIAQRQIRWYHFIRCRIAKVLHKAITVAILSTICPKHYNFNPFFRAIMRCMWQIYQDKQLEYTVTFRTSITVTISPAKRLSLHIGDKILMLSKLLLPSKHTWFLSYGKK